MFASDVIEQLILAGEGQVGDIDLVFNSIIMPADIMTK